MRIMSNLYPNNLFTRQVKVNFIYTKYKIYFNKSLFITWYSIV